MLYDSTYIRYLKDAKSQRQRAQKLPENGDRRKAENGGRELLFKVTKFMLGVMKNSEVQIVVKGIQVL